MGSIVASVRSAISLPSLRTQASHGSRQGNKLEDGTHLPYTKVGGHGSSTSHGGTAPPLVPKTHTLSEATYSISRGSTGHSEVDEDAIHVKKAFSQVESAV